MSDVSISTTHLMRLEFNDIAPHNNIQIYFEDSPAAWALSEKAGISIVPSSASRPFQCSGFSVNTHRISLTPLTNDSFTLQLVFATSESEITVNMNLMQGTVEISLPTYGQTGTYSAGSMEGVTLPLRNNI